MAGERAAERVRAEVLDDWTWAARGEAAEVLRKKCKMEGTKGIGLEGDITHAKLLLEEWGMTEAKAVGTPGTTEETRENDDEEQQMKVDVYGQRCTGERQQD